MHILLTTNTSAIAAVLTSTIVSWVFIGKPDLGMTINGCLAGLVAITGGCAYISIVDSLIIGAVAGIIVVFAVLFFDRVKVDDPVGATSVHLCCGVQKGMPEYYRGLPVETNLLPKVQVDIVVSKVPVRTVIETAKKVLYTGHIGDGKIFVYDVENVVKVRTGEEGYDALQDVE